MNIETIDQSAAGYWYGNAVEQCGSVQRDVRREHCWIRLAHARDRRRSRRVRRRCLLPCWLLRPGSGVCARGRGDASWMRWPLRRSVRSRSVLLCRVDANLTCNSALTAARPAGEADPSPQFSKDRVPPANPPSRLQVQRWISRSQAAATEPGYGYGCPSTGATESDNAPPGTRGRARRSPHDQAAGSSGRARGPGRRPLLWSPDLCVGRVAHPRRASPAPSRRRTTRPPRAV